MGGKSAREFAFDLTRFNVESREHLENVVRYIALTLDQKVVLRTPVDTGRARANWYPSIGQPSDEVDETDFDKTGAQTIGEIAAVVVNAQLGSVIWLTNNLPYIVRLEDGYSGQAPTGMVDVSLEEVASMFP